MNMLSNEEISFLCMELSVFMHAGIGVGESMYLLAEESSGEEKEQFLEMAREIEAGAFLSDVMKKTEKFPRYVVGLIRVGEHSGCLEEALGALSTYYGQRAEQDRQIKTALLYPSLLMILLLSVITILLVRVLPVFQKVYESFGGQFTGVAGGLLALGDGLRNALPFLMILFGLIIVGMGAFVTNYKFRAYVLKWWKKRFGDKGVFKKITDAHLAQAIAMGLHSGLHLEETLKLTEELQGEDTQAGARCRVCREYLEDGMSFADAMKKAELFPKGACQMLAMGLRSGTSDQIMEEIVHRLTRECEEELENKVSKIEPAIVLFASAIVGVILLSVMIPLMNIMSAIG